MSHKPFLISRPGGPCRRRLKDENPRLDRLSGLSQNSHPGQKRQNTRLQPARALPSPRTHYRKRRRLRRTASGGSLPYNLRFPGQYYMAETGLNQNVNRDYDPLTGKYIESDPIGLRGGLNTYNYVANNPISGIDPLGLAQGQGCCSKSYIDCLADCIRAYDPLNNFGKGLFTVVGGTFPKSWIGLPQGLGGASPLTTLPSAAATASGGGAAGTAGAVARAVGRFYSPLWIWYGTYLFGMEVYCASSCAANSCAH